MSHFFGRRFVSGTTDGYVVTDHGGLTGLFPDDDHQQYLITSAIRVVESANSGINKTGTDAGDVFSLINSGSGAALFIQQIGNTTNADAALDIDNSENSGRGLSVFSTVAVPILPLVQFSALDESFDEPVLLITHASPNGLALKVLGDGYLSGHLTGPQSVQFTSLSHNPVDLGDTGIYIEGEPGIFYFVDKDGRKYTFGDVNLLEGDGIDIRDIGGLTEISADVSDLFGTGLGTEVGFDGYLNLRLDADASMIVYDDSGNTFVIGDTVQEALDAIDGYFQRSCDVIRIHKLGTDAVDAPFNSLYTLDGYTYDIGQNKLVVAINGLVQNTPTDYTEYSESSIEFSDPLDDDDEIDIIILPCGIGASSGGEGSGGGSDTLQTAYDNSPANAKNINEDSGQITITQLAASGSVLRLISNTSLTTALNVDQSGSGTGTTIKSVDETNSTLLLQKDAPSRNSVKNSVIIERTTSHVSGGLTGIGSAILTRLESTATNLFSASRIITGTESAADSIEDTFLAIELSNDGILQENLRLTSIGNLGLGTTAPNSFKLQVAGDVGPDADNTYNLGSPSLRWKDGYFGPGSVHIGTGRLLVNEDTGNLHFERNDNSQFNLLDSGVIDRHHHTGSSWDYGADGKPFYIANHESGLLSGAFSVTTDMIVAIPFIAPSTQLSIDQIGIRHFSANSGARSMLGIYSNKGVTDLYPDVRLFASAELDTSAGGSTIVTSVSLALEPGELYWAVVHCGTATTQIRNLTVDNASTILGYTLNDALAVSLAKQAVSFTSPLPSPFVAGAGAQGSAPAIGLRFI